jgi:hypothetical protein
MNKAKGKRGTLKKENKEQQIKIKITMKGWYYYYY